MVFFNRQFKGYSGMRRSHPNLYSILLGVGVILFWRFLWGLCDLYLFPENDLLSYLVSGIVGLILLFFNDFKLKEIE